MPAPIVFWELVYEKAFVVFEPAGIYCLCKNILQGISLIPLSARDQI